MPMPAQTHNALNHDKDEVDIDPNAPISALPMKPKALYTSVIDRMLSFLPLKKAKDAELRLPQPSPKIVRTFTHLGTNLFGQPTEIDDRANTLPDGLRFMSIDGPHSKATKELNKAAIALLHNPRRKAPQGNDFLASRTNSPGEEYPFARRSQWSASASLPDSHHVFDDLLNGSQTSDHVNGMNGLCTALAIVISLSITRVNETKPEYNETSSMLDLSALYGVDGSETDLIRAKDGRGVLSPDCFFDDRARFLPPAVSALLILWNRNHNYIARHLLLNNEGKKWIDPPERRPTDSTMIARLAKQDEEIFQIARSINCVQFKNVVAEDFLKVVAGLPNVGPATNLDISLEIEHSEKGKGHDATVEFSLLYSHWSSLRSTDDMQVVEQAFQDELGDKITAEDLRNALSRTSNLNPNKRDRHLAGLQRGVDSRFKDDELAAVLQDATEHAAGSPGARGMASLFRAMELRTVERARAWKVGSLNDFRKFLGLKTFKTFKEWNPNPEIAQAAENLYTSVDNLELYPGLHAEQAMPGSGLSLGYTMTFALLVDLVTRIRSDPKFTTEFTPGMLTRWGYKDCVTPPDNGAFGAWLPKLLQRNLPRNYPYDNIYGLFPLTTPKQTATLLPNLPERLLGPDSHYDYKRPALRVVRVVETKEAISYVFNKPTTYPTIYGNDLKTLSNGYGYFLGFDDETLHDREQMMTLFALIPDRGALGRYASYFGKTAATLIRDKSARNNGNRSIDIVRDVINATCTRWVCQTLCGLNMSDDNDEVTIKHENFAALYAYIFRNIDPETGWAVRTAALKASRELNEAVEKNLPIPHTRVHRSYIQSYVDSAAETFKDVYEFASRIRQEMTFGKPLPQHSASTFLDRIVKLNRVHSFRLGDLTKQGHLKTLVDIEEHDYDIVEREEALERQRVLANIIGLAVVTSVNYAQACAQAVDFYLEDKYTDERKEIIRLSCLSPSDAHREHANTKIMGYIREAQRLGQPLGLWRNVAEDDSIPQGHGLPPIAVRKGEHIFADFNKAHTNPADFPNPFVVDPSRRTPSIQGMGLHKCPGISFVDNTMPELFKAIFRLKNLRRDTGKAGRLERFVHHPAPRNTDPKVYMDSTGEMSHFPRSLSLVYDDDGSQEGSASIQPTKKKWRNLIDSTSPDLAPILKIIAYRRRIMDRAISVVIFIFVLYNFIFFIIFLLSNLRASLPSLRASLPNRPSHPVRTAPAESEVKREFISCGTPTDVFHPWNITSFVPGASAGADDASPMPISYTLDSAKAHKLSIVDIDLKDTRFAVFVDDVMRGITPDFELDRTVDCGEDLRVCLREGFSAGVVVVPPGKHTVRVEWAGKDFNPGTRHIDWGEQRVRRLKWQREYCA